MRNEADELHDVALKEVMRHLTVRNESQGVDRFDVDPIDYGGYSEELYPGVAVRILQMVSEGKYPGPNPSNTMDAAVLKWMRTHVTDPGAYLRELLEALRVRGCVNAVASRLNVAVLSQPNRDTITISSKFGVVSVASRVGPGKLDLIPSQNAWAVKKFCDGCNEKYVADLKSAVPRMESLNGSLDYEQAVMVRIAYLVLHSMLQGKVGQLGLPEPRRQGADDEHG